MGDRRNTPLHGTPEQTGYQRAYSYPQLPGSSPPIWYTPPPPPKEKTAFEKIREWLPTVFTILGLAFAGGKAWSKLEQLERDSAAEQARAVAFEQKLNAIGTQAAATATSNLDTAAQVRELNETLKRLSLTGPRRRPRPEPPSTP